MVPSAEPASNRSRLRTAAIAAGVLAVALLLGWGLTYTSLFGAKVLRVQGAGHLGQREILRLAQITPGVNVFHLDAGAAERRIEQSSWVASATVATELPSTVVVTVSERVPVAMVRNDSGGASLVAGDGVAVTAASGREMLPAISSANVGAIPVDVTLRDGAVAASSMPPALRSQARSIVVGDDGSILVLLRSGVAVSYGTSADLSAKDQSLQAVLLWAQQQGKSVVAIDVSVPSAPTATLAGGVVTTPR